MTLRAWLGIVLVASATALGSDVVGDDARALGIEAPSPVVLGETIAVRAVFQNTGSSTWDFRYGCLTTWRCREPDAPSCAEDEHKKLEPLARSVAPGEWLVLELDLPTMALGAHVIVVQLQDPEGAPFGDQAGPVLVEVTTDLPALSGPAGGGASRQPLPSDPRSR